MRTGACLVFLSAFLGLPPDTTTAQPGGGADPLKEPAPKDFAKFLDDCLKAYGEKNKLDRLTTPKWEGEMNDGWRMTALAVRLLRADGAYRGPAGQLYVFMVIRDLKAPEEK